MDGVGCKGKRGNGQGEGREKVEMGGEKEGWARASVDGARVRTVWKFCID